MIGYNKNEIIGKMRERVILQNRVISQSDSGFQSETYSNIATLWTALDYKTGFEEEDADKIVSQQKINFTLRYNQNITTDSRFVYRNSLYQIEKIDISNDRRFVFCTGIYRSSYTGSYALTIDVAASVNSFATLSANVNSLLYLACQSNVSASTTATLTSGQQLIIEVASSVTANATSTANLTKVISVDSNMAANANINGLATVVKFVQSSLNATATTTSVLEVISQGIVSVDASLTATANVTADIKRTATLVSSSTTSATTILDATLTKVVEASMSATATTESASQIAIVVNASAIATANISGDASLSYSVNAALIASAQAIVNAQISRVIFAEMTATAQTTLEAAVGVTFVSSSIGTATLVSADLLRIATMVSNLDATANLTTASPTTVHNVVSNISATANLTTATLTTVDNVAASVSAAATITNANLQLFDPNYANVSLLLHGNGANGSTTFTDNSPNALTVTGVGNTQISTAQSKFGGASILFDGTGDYLSVNRAPFLTLGSSNFTIEFWVYAVSSGTIGIYGSRTTQTFRGLMLYIINNKVVIVATNNTTSWSIDNSGAPPGSAISLNQWTHICLSRSGSTWRVFINGNIDYTITSSISILETDTSVNIGSDYNGTNSLNGYLDDFRITVGIARYTAAFTPPDRQFLDQ